MLRSPFLLGLSCLSLALLLLALSREITVGQESPGGPPALDSGIPAIERRLPPMGIELDSEVRASLERRVRKLTRALENVPRGNSRYADIAIFEKAVRYALMNREFYKKQDVKIAEALLDRAEKAMHLDVRAKTKPLQPGPRVFGFTSKIDLSAQPYGLEVMDGIEGNRPVPLYVWLHGRGDKTTDLHFINSCLKRKGQFQPKGALVLHPFGRQCIGYKSAGEIDVLEAIEDVKRRYRIDEDRIVIMGFSMGGAGAWHLGAHYAERWAAVHAGAGFAETKEYIKLPKEKYPAWYEQKLWGAYDVPDYARNLLNVPVIAYSGEKDKQIQAARVMERELKTHGHTLKHVIGPGMGHKYHPESIKEISSFLAGAVEKGRQRFPKELHFQTKTLRYPKFSWLKVETLEKHWEDSRVDAEIGEKVVRLKTKNIGSMLVMNPRQEGASMPVGTEFEIDGISIKLERPGRGAFFVKKKSEGDGALWIEGTPLDLGPGLRKKPGLQGPIDDAFLDSFLVVEPTGKAAHPKVDAWTKFEIARLKNRWRELYRGDLPVKKDSEVTREDVQGKHLVLFGDPSSNKLIGPALLKIPGMNWSARTLQVGAKPYPSAGHVLAMIYPNPLNQKRYVVLNSGPTFRESHDRTNSLQNPKLPDWAVFDLSKLPDGEAAGKIAAAGFFDEKWSLQKGE